MNQRVANLLDDGFVEFGRFAVDIKFDVLAELARQVAHDPRVFIEGVADRHHPDLHDDLMNLVHVAAE